MDSRFIAEGYSVFPGCTALPVSIDVVDRCISICAVVAEMRVYRNQMTQARGLGNVIGEDVRLGCILGSALVLSVQDWH